MIKIRIKSTGEIQEVTRNIAHDLIDRGIGELLTNPIETPNQFKYNNRQINPLKTNRFRIK